MAPAAAHKPFDSTLKEMSERRPRPWMRLLLGRPVVDVQVINADLSTITAEADKLFLIQDPDPCLVRNEFESTYKAEAPLKGLRYSVLARSRHGLPVRTIFVLLRPEADGQAFSGTPEEEWPDGTKYLVFRYNVVRVWELPTEPLLAGDLATLPLAPISRVSEEDLYAVVRRVRERIGQEASPDEAAELLAATGFLLGLTHSGEPLKALLEGLGRMRESATYQLAVEEGEVREGKRWLHRLGERLIGPMSPEIQAKIEKIDDLDRLHHLADRLLEVST
jgi:predicted transposase YdaD